MQTVITVDYKNGFLKVTVKIMTDCTALLLGSYLRLIKQ